MDGSESHVALASVITLSRDHKEFLGNLLGRSSEEKVTYQEVGLTSSRTLPAGYRHDRLREQVGQGDEDWIRAQKAIRRWRAHAHAGVTITPADASIETGGTVLASRGFGPLLLVAPCRIVYDTDAPGRFGFAYGTLPGHPEQGEEAFHVVRDEDGVITVEIVAFSRPSDLSTRLAGPIARWIQTAVTRQYVEGVRDYVRSRA
jgi:uncharacterized protein (UPF0548 family)